MTPAFHPAFISTIEQAPTLPPPGAGQTLQRWRHLSAVAAQDLSLCKLAEAHWDALAILHDLQLSHLHQPGMRWAVWAADPPHIHLRVQDAQAAATLEGSKSWCTGAVAVTHALMTCFSSDPGVKSYVCVLDMQASGITLDHSGWQALGMPQAPTAQLHFSATPVHVIGERSLYLQRPGFWHGGAGIAACWFGAACTIAQKLRQQLRAEQPHAAAHLGAMFAELRAARAMLMDLAYRIDDEPHEPWVEEVLALRSMVRNIANSVIEHSTRAMGPGPLCQDRVHAQRCLDLALWCTQQHAERDDAQLGTMVQSPEIGWEL